MDDVVQAMENFARGKIQEDPSWGDKTPEQLREEEQQYREETPPDIPSEEPRSSTEPPDPYANEEPEPPPKPEKGNHSLSEFEKLARVGYGTKVVEFGEGELEGNRILIRTLDQNEEFKALEKASTLPVAVQGKAFAMYALATGLEEINGERWFKRKPVGPDDDTLNERFEQLKRLYPVLVDRLIQEHQQLRSEIEEKAIYAKKE